jgi:hypothetical protein
MTLLRIIGLTLKAWWGGCLSAFATPVARYGIRLREDAERELRRLK